MTDSVHVRADVPILDPITGGPQARADLRSASIDTRTWRPRGHDFDALRNQDALLAIFDEVRQVERWDTDVLMRILARHPRDGKALASDDAAATGFFAKIELVKGYQQLTAAGLLPFERTVLRRLQMKPIRTSSGVAPVTVLTEPAGCPGHCIFCPDAEGMPKSYLPMNRARGRGAVRLRSLSAGSHPAGDLRGDGPHARQGRTADSGRHLERLLAKLPRVVRQAVSGCHERGGF